MMKVIQTIGTPRLIVEAPNECGTVLDLSIPRELVGEVMLQCLVYASHNGLLSEEQRQAVIDSAGWI